MEEANLYDRLDLEAKRPSTAYSYEHSANVKPIRKKFKVQCDFSKKKFALYELQADVSHLEAKLADTGEPAPFPKLMQAISSLTFDLDCKGGDVQIWCARKVIGPGGTEPLKNVSSFSEGYTPEVHIALSDAAKGITLCKEGPPATVSENGKITGHVFTEMVFPHDLVETALFAGGGNTKVSPILGPYEVIDRPEYVDNRNSHNVIKRSGRGGTEYRRYDENQTSLIKDDDMRKILVEIPADSALFHVIADLSEEQFAVLGERYLPGFSSILTLDSFHALSNGNMAVENTTATEPAIHVLPNIVKDVLKKVDDSVPLYLLIVPVDDSKSVLLDGFLSYTLVTEKDVAVMCVDNGDKLCCESAKWACSGRTVVIQPKPEHDHENYVQGTLLSDGTRTTTDPSLYESSDDDGSDAASDDEESTGSEDVSEESEEESGEEEPEPEPEPESDTEGFFGSEKEDDGSAPE